MERFLATLRQSTQGCLAVFLLVFVAVVAFDYLIYQPKGSPAWTGAVAGYMLLAAEPWMSCFRWVMTHYWRSGFPTSLLVSCTALFLAINSAAVYLFSRFAWIGLRPNNSFKPNPHQGGA